MFKKLKSLFFVEEEVEIEPEETSEIKDDYVSSNDVQNVEKTLIINRLETVELPQDESVEKAKTFTFKETKPAYEKKERPQINYEFETIISPITGRTTKQKSANKSVKISKPKVTPSNDPSAYTTVISPMFGLNKQNESKNLEVDDRLDEEEVTLEQILANNDNEEEIVQVSLFEGEEQ